MPGCVSDICSVAPHCGAPLRVLDSPFQSHFRVTPTSTPPYIHRQTLIHLLSISIHHVGLQPANLRSQKHPQPPPLPLRARVRPPYPPPHTPLTHHSDYADDGTNILLDANENAYGPSLPDSPKTSHLHRYPSPYQIPLKQLFCNLRNTPTSTSPPLTPDNLFLGVGSDEAIDVLLRAFCIPSVDKILVCPPTYGMYTVSACVNDVAVVKVPLLTTPGFPLDVAAINAALAADDKIKMVYVCTPGNPTGALLDPKDIETLLNHPTWNGIVVADEAYVDFAGEGASLAPRVTAYKNLVVMQTLSKAFGLAGIRLGVAFCDPAVAGLLNALKAPYNVSTLAAEVAERALSEGLEVGIQKREKLVQQRGKLVEALKGLEGMGEIKGGLHANFILIEVLNKEGKPDNTVSQKVYEELAEEARVVVRFRGKEYGCLGCIRITVGTEEENGVFLERLREVLQRVRG